MSHAIQTAIQKSHEKTLQPLAKKTRWNNFNMNPCFYYSVPGGHSLFVVTSEYEILPEDEIIGKKMEMTKFGLTQMLIVRRRNYTAHYTRPLPLRSKF